MMYYTIPRLEYLKKNIVRPSNTHHIILGLSDYTYYIIKTIIFKITNK